MNKKLVLFILSMTLLFSCNMYSDNENLSDEFAEVCIKGHVYYIRSVNSNGLMASKLQDDGRPVKCDK